MKIVALIVTTVLLCIAVGAQQNRSDSALAIPAGNWVLCDKAEAEYIAHVRYKFSGVISETEYIQYVRAMRPAKLLTRKQDGSELWSNDFGKTGVDGFYADGKTKAEKGCGYSGSVGIEMNGGTFVLRVDLCWDADNDRGQYQKEWKFSELKTCSVKDGRFRADIRLERKPANQPPEPTR